MISKELLCRYLDGQCTEQEIAKVQKYLAEDPQAAEAFEEVLNDAWETVQDHTIQRDETERHLQKLQATLYPEKGAKIRTLQVKRWMMYAAAILVAAGMITLYMWPRPAATPAVAVLAKWDTLVNQTTSTQRHQLPDHSVAWLSPGSQLFYSMSTAEKRTVKLEGEAFFDVAHEPQRPFTVQTGRMITRVLGTAFNVEAYGKESTMRVSLLRGKVAVQQETPGAAEHTTLETLLPGEMVTYSKSNSTVHKEPLLVKEIEQWTSGNLVLNDVLLTDALDRIAARHQLMITTSEAIRKSSKRVSTVFKKETPQQMMEILGFITGCRYRSNTNGTIVIF